MCGLRERTQDIAPLSRWTSAPDMAPWKSPRPTGKEERKMPRRIFSFALILGCLILGSQAHSQDETALFTSVAPDTLVVLDLSGSMLWTPAGSVMYTSTRNDCDSTGAAFYSESGPSHTQACTINPYGTVPKYAARS